MNKYDKGRKMNNEQMLYHHKIYQKNRLLAEFKRVCGIDEKRTVSLSILNFHNRKFNWYVVGDNGWTFDEHIIKNINECMDREQSEWESFYDKLKKLDIEGLDESIDYFKSGDRKTADSGEKEMSEFNFHFLNLYQYYPHEALTGIDGVIYRNFINKRKRLYYAQGELQPGLKNFDIYPWIDMGFVYKSGEEIRCLSAQEKMPNNLREDRKYTTRATFDKKIKEIQEIKTTALSEDKVYFNYLVPLIMGYPDPNNDNNDFKGRWIKKKGNEKKGKIEYFLDDDEIRTLLTKLKYITCFPVYDAFIDKGLYGNFYGNVTIFFEFEGERYRFAKENHKKIEENLFLLLK
jgi:hypothetical protein